MRQTIVIGSVPAGYTAGIYAGRVNLNPLLIASSVEAGGELVKTTEVENGEVHEALSVIFATGSAYRKHPR